MDGHSLTEILGLGLWVCLSYVKIGEVIKARKLRGKKCNHYPMFSHALWSLLVFFVFLCKYVCLVLQQSAVCSYVFSVLKHFLILPE